MFRKLLFASVASLGVLSPLAIPTNAQAHEPGHEHHHAYRVFYRDPCRPGWVCAGSFSSRRVAYRFAEPYRCRGLVIEIR